MTLEIGEVSLPTGKEQLKPPGLEKTLPALHVKLFMPMRVVVPPTGKEQRKHAVRR
jgi:hypothetical protein